jgi:hypothetical protein
MDKGGPRLSYRERAKLKSGSDKGESEARFERYSAYLNLDFDGAAEYDSLVPRLPRSSSIDVRFQLRWWLPPRTEF